MSLLLDTKYLNYASSRLEGFSWIRPHLGNCRCPFCGDSSKKVNKRRFYFYRKTTPGADSDRLRTHCHNCNYTQPFGKWLQEFDSHLYGQYKLEAYKERSSWADFYAPKQEPVATPKPPTGHKGAPPASIAVADLPEDHFCRQYVVGRRITQLNLLYFSEDFKATVAAYNPELKDKVKSEPRLIIPFYDENGYLTCIQGRSFSTDPDDIRYLTIKRHDASSKVFGLERLDKKKTVTVVEGPLDSLFVPNCVATADSNLLVIDWGDLFIPDNQYRNPQVCNLIERIIDAGKKVVLFPESVKWKDLNDMVSKGGMSKIDLLRLIASNAHSGLTARNVFSRLRKI